jgi:hypothetical protein
LGGDGAGSRDEGEGSSGGEGELFEHGAAIECLSFYIV